MLFLVKHAFYDIPFTAISGRMSCLLYRPISLLLSLSLGDKGPTSELALNSASAFCFCIKKTDWQYYMSRATQKGPLA